MGCVVRTSLIAVMAVVALVSPGAALAGEQAPGAVSGGLIDEAQGEAGGYRTVPYSTIPNSGCRRTGAYVTQRNSAGVRIYTYTVSKYWCWNRAKRKVTVKDGAVSVEPSVNTASGAAGWDYKGSEGKADYLYDYGPVKKGGHWTYRRGFFKYCPPRAACATQLRPFINLRVHYDGTASESHGVK